MANYKEVEANNLVGLRNGHIIAQTPLLKTDYNQAVVENGLIFVHNGAKLGLMTAGTIENVPLLHFTEELLFEGRQMLKDFAVEWNDEDIAYPRAIALYVGDTFTTNNYTGTPLATDKYTVTNGVFTKYTAGEALAHQFYGVLTTLPDGVTPALELTYLGFI